MDLNSLCMGCLGSKESFEACPLCGWVEGSAPVSLLHLAPRTVLNKKYLLGKALGQGGFGITYLAWDCNLERKLAIKEFFPRELVSRAPGEGRVDLFSRDLQEQYRYGLEKFLAEAKTLALFESHPSIVAVKDYFEEYNTAYLVMPYLEGLNLFEYLLQKEERLELTQAVQIIMPILDALKVVHQKGLMHRDVSPDNIFITKEGRVILLDFGAARHALGEKAKNVSIILKPGFAPEEQYRLKSEQGPWTDIYAAAATLYRMITGQMVPDALERLNEDLIIRPLLAKAAVSAPFEEVLLKALAVKAKDRFQTVAAFQEALLSATSAPGSVITTASFDDRGLKDESAGPQKGPSGRAAALHFAPQSGSEQEVTVGRDLQNMLVLSAPTVSRFHARLFCQKGQWHVEDLNSTQGTFVNEQRLTGCQKIYKGDYLKFSSEELYFDGQAFYDAAGSLLFSAESFAGAPPAKGAAKKLGANKKGLKIALIGAVLLLFVALFALVQKAGLFSPQTAQPTLGNSEQAVLSEDAASLEEILEGEEVTTQGVISYLGGTYEGQLKNGLPHGLGVLVYEAEQTSAGLVQLAERKYEGQWLNGQMHGEGVMIYPDGTKRTGIWENNHYVGAKK